MTLSKFPSRRRSETVISGHICYGAEAAAFNDSDPESVKTSAFDQNLSTTKFCFGASRV